MFSYKSTIWFIMITCIILQSAKYSYFKHNNYHINAAMHLCNEQLAKMISISACMKFILYYDQKFT